MTAREPAEHLVWRWHAFEPMWAPEADFVAVYDWLSAHGLAATASAEYPITVYEHDGGSREIECGTVTATGGLSHTRVPLRSGPPDVARPDIPHLAELQAVLGQHVRADVPVPLMVLGDTLDAHVGALLPAAAGGAICAGACRDELGLVAWPCRPAAEAARRSGVHLW